MDLSNQTPHTRVTNESSNPLQSTIHLPSSNPNFNSNSNSSHPNLDPCSVQNHFISQPIRRRKRRGRPRNPTTSTFQASPATFENVKGDDCNKSKVGGKSANISKLRPKRAASKNP